jgi:hypothetical protein
MVPGWFDARLRPTRQPVDFSDYPACLFCLSPFLFIFAL